MIRYSTGLRDKLNGMQGVVKGAVIGAGLTFVDGGGSADTITDSGNNFITEDFAPGDKLFVRGCTTAANDTALTGVRITNVAAGTLTIPTGSVNTGEVGAAGTVVAVAKGGSLKDVMKDGVLNIYSGTQPSEADDAVVGTLLVQVTVSSGAFVAGAFDNGLEFENDPTDGVIEKDSDIWSGIAVATGVAGWFRFVANAADAGAESTTLPRIDGSIGTNGDMIMSSTNIVINRSYTIDTYSLTLPAYYGA